MYANANRLLLYSGLAGATLIVAYGFLKLSPATPVMKAPMAERAVVPAQQVVIAKVAIHRGDVVTAEDLGLLPVEGALPAMVQTSMAGIVGKIAVADIAGSQFVLSNQISADPGKAGLAMLVPAGYRAIAFLTNDEVAVGSFIRSGDHVDVQLVLPEAVLPGAGDAASRAAGSGSETHTLLQDVTVLTVGDAIASPEASSKDAAPGRRVDPPRNVTLAMTPDQVTEFVLARSIGTVFLTLRNPTDPGAVSQDTARLRDIRGATPAPTASATSTRRPIELVTGSQSRIIYSQSAGGQQ